MVSYIVVLILLIFLNAFFAAAEMAFVSLNDAKLEIQAKAGNKKAKKIKGMLKDPSKFLATIQIGVTLAGFLSSAFASDAFADILAPMLHVLIPNIEIATLRSISIVVITIILSYFTLVFGELVPKRIAMKNPEMIAFGSVKVLGAISFFTAPFVKLLTKSTNIVSKMFGVTGEDEEIVTEEEIRMMVDVGEEKGAIDSQEKEMINNIFEFDDKTVSEIMVPRTEVFALDMNLSIGEVIDELTDDSRYSRIPVYEETIDEIKGIVHIKDILLSTKNKNTKIKNLMKEAYFVPENKLVNELFSDLRKNKKSIAVVIDEYGGTAGIVTMEDVLEEIVGEIYDEYDKIENKFEKIDENTYIFDGSIAIFDVEKILDIKIPDGYYDTLSGFLLEELGRIPNDKEKLVIETKEATYKIEKMEDKKIERVKVCKNNIVYEDDDNLKDTEKND